MRPMSTLNVAGRAVGGDSAAFLIAEAGVNHNGDMGRARELVDIAADAGADAVKFQTFDPAALATRSAPIADYQRRAGSDVGDQITMLERLALDDDEFAQLAAHARDRGIVFLSSPFDERSAELLDRLDVAAFKVGSGELTNVGFLRRLAGYGRPMLVSTGMGTLDEVGAAVDAVTAGGAPGLALLHCVSSYPTPVDQANLRAIATLRDAFPAVPIGYSDHCLGIDVSLAAVALGACVLERHVTTDRTLPGPAHAASLEPGELADLVVRVRAIESALGDGLKQPQSAERNTMAVARRSLVAARDLPAGAVIAREDLAVKRPGGGLAPGLLESVVGARLARPVTIDELLTAEHLQT